MRPSALGSGTRRGSARGTVTTPSAAGGLGPVLPLRFERSSSAMHSALFSTRGNGCDGSIVTGVSSGSTWFS